jgi:hypothetical protein
MRSTRVVLIAVVAFVCSGCIHDAVPRGALIGALSGAVLGAGTGLVISDEHLLGSSKQSGIQLDVAGSVGTGALLGGVFGAIVGAMIGHQRNDRPYLQPQTERPQAEQARAEQPRTEIDRPASRPELF